MLLLDTATATRSRQIGRCGTGVRWSFFQSSLAVLLLFLASTNAQDRPNIILIYCDDLGLGDLGVTGHPYAVTPHIDALASQGTLFTQMHNTGNVCPTSRAGLLTSRNPSWYPNYTEDYGFLGVPTVMRLLQDHTNYRTAHVGKWNIGEPTPPQAPVPPLTANQVQSHDDYGIDDVRVTRTRPGDTRGREGLRFDQAIDFIQSSARDHPDQPWYINLWLTVPHSPLTPTDEVLKPFDKLRVRTSDFSGHFRTKLERLQNDERIDIQDVMRKYMAEVYALDLQVGRLVATLESLGLTDDTLVVFASDNGPAKKLTGSSAQLRGGKHDYYQGGYVGPFIVKWPQHVPAGGTNTDSVMSMLDWLPTVAAIAGVPQGVPEDGPNGSTIPPWQDRIEGEDMSAVWLGTSTASRSNPLFWQDLLGRSKVAVRYNEWKLLDWRQELYNLDDDPEERTNVWNDHPNVVEALLSSIAEWKATLPNVHARLPQAAYPFEPNKPAQVIGPPQILLLDGDPPPPLQPLVPEESSPNDTSPDPQEDTPEANDPESPDRTTRNSVPTSTEPLDNPQWGGSLLHLSMSSSASHLSTVIGIAVSTIASIILLTVNTFLP